MLTAVRAASFFQEQKMKMRKIDQRLLLWLWTASEGLRLQSVLNALTGVTGVALDFAFIYASKWAIDIATGRAQSPLWWAAAVLVALLVMQVALGFARRWIAAILGVRSQNILQMKLFRHLMNSQWMGRDGRHSGDVLNRLERDTYDVSDTITETVPAALCVVVRLAGAFCFLCTMNVRVACLLLCIVAVPVGIVHGGCCGPVLRGLVHHIQQVVVLPEVVGCLVPQAAVCHLVTLHGPTSVPVGNEVLIERVELAQTSLVHIAIGLDAGVGVQAIVTVTCRNAAPGLTRLLIVAYVLVAQLQCTVIVEPGESAIVAA